MPDPIFSGNSYTIIWDSSDNDGVVGHDLYYSSDGGTTFTLIASNLSGIQRSYNWSVPSITTTALKIKVIARDATGNQGSDTSDGNCQIMTAPSFAAFVNNATALKEYNPYASPQELAEFNAPAGTNGVTEVEEVTIPTVTDTEMPEDVTTDSDNDGIPDSLERILARKYVPNYIWDSVEPNNFCYLQDLYADGADASRRAIGAADDHPLSVRRFAPAIKRLQRTVVPASPLARPPAADPQRRSCLRWFRLTHDSADLLPRSLR